MVVNNTDVFAAGFDASDRRIFTLMRIVAQLATGNAIYTTGENIEGMGVLFGPNGMVANIDWDQYFTEYEVMLALVKLARVHSAAATIPEDKEEEQDDSVLVFGGNHE